jgi:N-acetylglutamate synthase-like GNAT family acetyltransferase
MNELLTIEPIFNDQIQQVSNLILPIQQIEFNVPVTLKDQPDLLDIEANYHKNGGGFWGVKHEREVVGTIALIALGHNAGAIRKMFVKKEFRGKEMGIAQRLLETLLDYCRNHGITDIYLGTVDVLKAAHRFYERNNFERINADDLPSYFPRMAIDTIFYSLHLDLPHQDAK